jgi:CRISPR system Cascade subunit CasE
MTIHLMQCQPHPQALAVWATRHRLLSPDGDYGYALHALLTSAFGSHAPRPFRYLGQRQGLLAYSRLDLAALRDLAALVAPDIASALGLDSLAARPFPERWRVGQHLAFEVRTRPVVRANDGRERDAFLHALGPQSTEPADEPDLSERRVRSEVYINWLRQRFSALGAAEIEDSRVDAFQLTRLLVRPPNADTGKRGSRTVNGPDAVFKGHLRISDSHRFAALIQRGIGRHRAFGYGMLLLKPPC